MTRKMGMAMVVVEKGAGETKKYKTEYEPEEYD
jgi:hypothetical protein